MPRRSAILEVEDAVRVLDRFDIDRVKDAQNTAKNMVAARRELKQSFKTRAAIVNPQGATKDKKRRMDKEPKMVTIPHHLEQGQARSFVPAGCGIWQDLTRACDGGLALAWQGWGLDARLHLYRRLCCASSRRKGRFMLAELALGAASRPDSAMALGPSIDDRRSAFAHTSGHQHTSLARFLVGSGGSRPPWRGAGLIGRDVSVVRTWVFPGHISRGLRTHRRAT